MKKIVITRKIQLNVVSENQNVKEIYEKLYRWNEQVYRAANIAVTHMYFQEKQREFFYLSDGAKVLLSDALVPVSEIKSDKTKEMIEAGAVRMFNTSKQNTTYRVLSDKLKGEIPSDIFTNLNAQLVQNFSAESKEYYSGKRALRSYKRNMPIPFSSSSLKNKRLTSDGKNYEFDLFGITMRTYFGKDFSGNFNIWEAAMRGEYKLCNSSIQLDGAKIFLLAVFQFDSTELKGHKEMFAELGIDIPIIAKVGKSVLNIGDKEEFLYQRLAIQASLRRAQVAARFNKGGKGRNHKLANIDHFKEKEKDYISTKLHQYSRRLIDLCVKNKCGKLILKFANDPMVPEEGLTIHGKEKSMNENKFLLRNWSYYGLTEKLAYKCNKVGIELIIEKQ